MLRSHGGAGCQGVFEDYELCEDAVGGGGLWGGAVGFLGLHTIGNDAWESFSSHLPFGGDFELGDNLGLPFLWGFAFGKHSRSCCWPSPIQSIFF